MGNELAEDLLDADISCSKVKKSMWRLRRHLEFLGDAPEYLGNWKIVRPVHSFYPLPHLIFSKKNSYITYNPDNFLSIYKSCAGVVSDRVHAGVVALSYGKPVKIEALDSRYEIFAEAPILSKKGFMTIDEDKLNQRFDNISNWLRVDFREALNYEIFTDIFLTQPLLCAGLKQLFFRY